MLAERGSPWQPDPSISDHERLPVYPTGGDGVQEPVERLLPDGGVDDVLKGHPPTNPDLRAVWHAEGLLDTPDEPDASKHPAGRRRSGRARVTPAPDTGG
jgi:hypothetical protein